ncbi:phospholipid phosphatase 2-like isoform X2 [Eriocheir sinensis]|uniref:phospholipid phosphatase 2-like isoform X2 n=1 Tax=Eriocheir sinensis TaxID=95602 RepID=UPI0021C871A8|nr:phospholipid phosphatase 2-like isoform X2 [Eriocheir sinensis]
MTSESTEEEARKRRRSRVACVRRHKGKCGWLFTAGLLVLLLGVVAPSHTTISCKDTSIRRDVKKDTVNIGTLFTISLIVPFFVMTLIEYLVPPSTQTPPGTTPIRASLRRGWRYFTDLFVGVLFTYFFTDLLKTSVGEARPNFWNTCKPNLTEEQCSQDYITVTWKDCTNPGGLKHWRLAETMKSFPSGHASISVYSVVFMIIYTHKRLWQRWSSLSSPFVQMLWLTWAVVCCQSRIWDNKHFWWDVLVGAMLGVAGGFLTVHFLTNWFEREDESPHPSPPKEDSPPPSSSASYIPEEEEEEEEVVENASHFSRTSIKRLIAEGGGGGGGGGGGSERELRHISSAP